MEIVTNIAPIALALFMLGLGDSLTVDDFLRVVKNPKDFFIGFICQLIVLPIVAYLLIITLSVPIEMALGVMLIAAAPGGVNSIVLT
jgi:BASS family bile acid:Na+ symporter